MSKVTNLILSAIRPIFGGKYFDELFTPDTPSFDSGKPEGPTTLVERGTYIPHLIGRRRVGPAFEWAGDRDTDNQKFYESSWHGLVVGPAYRLHAIYSAGKLLWQGPIERTTSPSGTTIDLGGEGSFTIYWGTDNQPLNTFLGSSARIPPIGIVSRWPNLCYIEWRRRKLGFSATWPLKQYDIETRPTLGLLTQTPAWIPSTLTPNVDEDGVGDSYAITAATAGAAKVATITISGKHAELFPMGHTFAVHETAGSHDGDYIVFSSENKNSPSRTVITLDQSSTLSSSGGYVSSYKLPYDDGVNVAHAVAQLLFAPGPQGCANDTALFDIPSLEALGVLSLSEHIAVSVITTAGGDAEKGISDLQRDFGFMISWSPLLAKYLFLPIRVPTTVRVIPADILIAPRLEVRIVHDLLPSDRLAFDFQDRALRFQNATVAIDEDGQASYVGASQFKKMALNTITDFATATRVGERRSQEVLASATEYPIRCNREGRTLVPGEAIIVPGFEYVLRVTEVSMQSASGRVEAKCLVDSYGIKASTFTASRDDPDNPTAPDTDIASRLFELPKHLDAPTQTTFTYALRVRAHVAIQSGTLYISTDNAHFQVAQEAIPHVTGGTLVSAMPADGLRFLEDGPVIAAIGPDMVAISQYLAATPDTLIQWAAGKQWWVVGGEIMYVRNVTALGAGLFQLHGILRARWDTEQAAHAIGDIGFLFDPSTLPKISSQFFQTERDIYFKVQPFTSYGLDLLAITSQVQHLIAAGNKEMRLSALWTPSGNPSWQAGDDVTIRFCYRNAGLPATSGAGLQIPGEACLFKPPYVAHILRLRTAGGVLKYSITATHPLNYPGGYGEFTVANATIVTAFAGEPSEMIAEVVPSQLAPSTHVPRQLALTRI